MSATVGGASDGRKSSAMKVLRARNLSGVTIVAGREGWTGRRCCGQSVRCGWRTCTRRGRLEGRARMAHGTDRPKQAEGSAANGDEAGSATVSLTHPRESGSGSVPWGRGSRVSGRADTISGRSRIYGSVYGCSDACSGWRRSPRATTSDSPSPSPMPTASRCPRARCTGGPEMAPAAISSAGCWSSVSSPILARRSRTLAHAP